MKVQGRKFVLMAGAPVLAGVLVFAFARFNGLTDSQFDAAATSVLNAGLKKMGVPPAAYGEPTRSFDKSGDAAQLCWSPLREGLNKLCVIYTKSTSELILYRVIEEPYRYERIDM